MANPFVHIELDTNDHQEGEGLLRAAICEWELKDMDMGPMGTYTTIGVGEGTGGGMMQHPMPGAPSLWECRTFWWTISRLRRERRRNLAASHQGERAGREMGKFSLVTDPTGATFGLWETAKNRLLSVERGCSDPACTFEEPSRNLNKSPAGISGGAFSVVRRGFCEAHASAFASKRGACSQN